MPDKYSIADGTCIDTFLARLLTASFRWCTNFTRGQKYTIEFFLDGCSLLRKVLFWFILKQKGTKK